MKKTLLIALMAALLLTGCGNPSVQTEPTVESTVETTIPTEPLPSFYTENSPMERGTGGAVKLYELDGTVTGMAMLGENLLVCQDGRKLCLMDRQTMKILKTRELDFTLSWEDESLVITQSGMAYYDEASRMYVTLDANLISVSTYVIDAEMTTRPVINRSFEKICYGTREGLEVMVLSDGTARRIRQEHQQILSVDGLLFDDAVLCYTRRTENGGEQTCFVNTEDGSLLDAAEFTGTLHPLGDRFACVLDLEHALGEARWLVTGARDCALQRLDSRYAWTAALVLPDGRAVLQSTSRVGMTLYCYDLESGMLLAQIIMPEQQEVLTLGGADGEQIWLASGTGNRVYCWDTTVDSRAGDSSELMPYASLSQADEAGMEQVKQLAGILGDRYDVTIRFAEEGNRTDGVDYTDFADLRPEQYDQALEVLERALEKLPEGLLYQLGRGADSGRVEVVLVDGYDPSLDAVQLTGSIDVSDGGLRLFVQMCPELEKIFFHELFHLMEVRIRTLTDGFKDWEEQNPKGFTYLNSYESVESGAMNSSAYLQLGSNYFADAYGMVSPREDRAQVFLYAMTDGEQTRFLSDTMQEKLSQIDKLIRKCFKLSEDVTAYWEQYLETEE